MPEKHTFRDSALRAVAIIGLIAILVLGAWGIIQLVVGLPDFFSNFGAHPSTTSTSPTTAEQVSVQAPSIVTSQQPFALAWSHTGGSGNYSFSISYSCADNLSFAAPTPTGQYQQVPCNTPFNYTNATNGLELVAVLAPSATKQVTTSVSISAVRLSDNKVTSVGSTTLTVLPAKATPQTPVQTTPAATTPAATKPAATYTASGRTSNLYGSADLAVQILSATPVNGRYQVQFEVSNVGTNVTPYGWEFTAQLPTSPTYTYQSQSQQKLYPGDKVVYTLGFDMSSYNTAYSDYPSGYNSNTYNNTYPNYYANTPNYYSNSPSYYGNQFSVTVDPQGLVSDANRSNNTASVSL